MVLRMANVTMTLKEQLEASLALIEAQNAKAAHLRRLRRESMRRYRAGVKARKLSARPKGD